MEVKKAKNSSEGKKKRALSAKKKKGKNRGEEEERVIASVEDSPLCAPISPQFQGGEMGFFELMSKSDLQDMEEGRFSKEDPQNTTTQEQEERGFPNEFSSSSLSSSLASSLTMSSSVFPTPPLSGPFGDAPHYPTPASVRRLNGNVHDELQSLDCLRRIMDNFSALQKVMRKKIELQRSLVQLFDETNTQFSKIDPKLASYANSVTQELVRQKEDGGVFADRLEGLNHVLGQITVRNSLREKDFPQVQVVFYQIEAAFRLKRTQNLAVRSYSLPPKQNNEGRREEEEGGEEGDLEFSLGEPSKWGGSPKGFLSMCNSEPKQQTPPISVTPSLPTFPPPRSTPPQRNNSTSPLISQSPSSPHSQSPELPSQNTSPSFSTSSSVSPPNAFSSSHSTSPTSIPSRNSYHLSPSSSFLSHSPTFGASMSAEDLKEGTKSPRKNKDSPMKKDVPKTPKKEKKAIKIHILQRRDSGKAIDKKPLTPSMEKRDPKISDHAAHRLSLRKEIEDAQEKSREPDFTAISLPDLLFFILEVAPVTSGYRRNFLSTFTLFSTSEDVIGYLINYLEGEGLDEEGIKKRTLGVILFVKRWIEGRFDTLKEEPVLHSLQNLISKITTLQPMVSSTLERILSQQMTNQPVDELKNQKQFDFVDLTWDKFDAVGLCQSICFEEFLLYQQITVDELLNWNCSRKREEKCPNIRAICNFSNHLATWVSTELVKRAKLSERADLLKKFVSMAELMLEMNNFSSCMSIIGGLNSSPISRLKNTWKEAGKDTVDQFERINQIMSIRGSYATYREYLKGVVPPCLPFLGMHLTDLTFICDGNVNPDDENLINFSKWEMMAQILHNVKHFQQFQYPPPAQMNNCLEAFENYQGLNEDELYDYSNFVEPKESEESNEHLIAKYQEVQDRLQKALQEIELLKSQGKGLERVEEEGEEVSEESE